MKPILIAGAGPGGLSAALALQSRGIDVHVLEQTPELRTAGAGLILAVNAMRLFHGVGVGEAIEAAGCKLISGGITTLANGPIQDFSFDRLSERFGFSNIGIHRGALSQILADALNTPIHFNAQVDTFSMQEEGVEVRLADGSTLKGSALIGADGIHSVVRRGLFGEHPLRYAGYTCWRGIAELPCPVGEGHFVELWDHGPRFGIVPISPTRTYWFATDNTEARGKDGPDPLAETKARFEHFGEPVRAMLAATKRVMRNDIIDFLPLPHWTLGRATLLGDAAHAMTPNMGQGANQAIEDGLWLASALASHPIEEGLMVYEKSRRTRANRLVEQSFTFGRLATLENPILVWLRDQALKRVPKSLLDRSAAELYGRAPLGLIQR